MRRPTARMLIGMVMAERPGWGVRRCAEWLSPRVPNLKASIRRHAKDWILMEMVEDRLNDESAGRGRGS